MNDSVSPQCTALPYVFIYFNCFNHPLKRATLKKATRQESRDSIRVKKYIVSPLLLLLGRPEHGPSNEFQTQFTYKIQKFLKGCCEQWERHYTDSRPNLFLWPKFICNQFPLRLCYWSLLECSHWLQIFLFNLGLVVSAVPRTQNRSPKGQPPISA